VESREISGIAVPRRARREKNESACQAFPKEGGRVQGVKMKRIAEKKGAISRWGGGAFSHKKFFVLLQEEKEARYRSHQR